MRIAIQFDVGRKIVRTISVAVVLSLTRSLMFEKRLRVNASWLQTRSQAQVYLPATGIKEKEPQVSKRKFH